MKESQHAHAVVFAVPRAHRRDALTLVEVVVRVVGTVDWCESGAAARRRGGGADRAYGY